MYKVKFLASNTIYDLVGFVNNKIIIKFNNGQSTGTVPKTGYRLLEKLTWEQVEKEINNA